MADKLVVSIWHVEGFRQNRYWQNWWSSMLFNLFQWNSYRWTFELGKIKHKLLTLTISKFVEILSSFNLNVCRGFPFNRMCKFNLFVLRTGIMSFQIAATYFHKNEKNKIKKENIWRVPTIPIDRYSKWWFSCYCRLWIVSRHHISKGPWRKTSQPKINLVVDSSTAYG